MTDRNNWLGSYQYAHRGLFDPSLNIIENSHSAFIRAEDHGYGIELDVQLSQDGQAMVFHDVELSRLTDEVGLLIDYSAEKLSQIQLKHSKDTIHTLQSQLSILNKQTPILIEIKGDQHLYKDIACAVYEIVKDLDQPIALMSFYPEILEQLQSLGADHPLGLVATSDKSEKLPAQLTSQEHQIQLIDQLDLDFIAYNIQNLPNKLSDYCSQNDLPLLTWTVRTAAEHERAQHYANAPIFERY